MAVGDLNSDGKLDLTTANIDTNNVSVLLGNGDGTFAPPMTFPLSSSYFTGPLSVAVGDFNGDRIPDLAAAPGGPVGSIAVLLGNGDGTFPAAQTFAVGRSPRTVAVGDFNADGVQDLAVTSNDPPLQCYRVPAMGPSGRQRASRSG